MTSLPAPSALATAPDADLTHLLDLLFEPTPQLHTLAIPILRSTPFATYDALITTINALLTDIARQNTPESITILADVLSSHPRLGEKKVDSEQSRREQAQLQSAGSDETEKLASLNHEYEARFPGLRYVVFVNGRSRPLIMQNMRSRIDRGDIAAERQEAIQAMCDIASDRASKLYP